MDAFVKNAADPEQVKSAGKKVSRKEQEWAADLRSLMTAPYGRRVLRRIFRLCGLNQLSHVRGDTHETSFNEGQRNVGLRILAECAQADPQLFAAMQCEAEPGEDVNG